MALTEAEISKSDEKVFNIEGILVQEFELPHNSIGVARVSEGGTELAADQPVETGSAILNMHPGGTRMLSPAVVTAPASPTPVEEIAAAIERVTPLQGLSLEDRLWLARHGEEVVGEPGQILFEEGAPADRMILILKGEIHVRRQRGGPMELFIGRAGQMTGYLPFRA